MKLKMYYELTISRKQLEERTFKDNLLYMVIYVMVDLSSWKWYKLTSGPNLRKMFKQHIGHSNSNTGITATWADDDDLRMTT